jgi:transposase InsO family protein
MCAFFGVSRAAYYAWKKKLGQADQDEERMRRVMESYKTSHGTYGYRRITLDLQQKQGLSINHKAVLRLMNRLGIRSVARKPNAYRRYARSEAHYKYPNHLDRNFVALKPNQKWVTDITYIWTDHGWCYLSTIKDLYDGFIVSYVFQRNNNLELVTKTVRLALEKEKVTDGLILHSDQGLQYTSQAYHELLTKEYNIIASMSRRGNCWDNAPMENFFGHLKEEYLRHFDPRSFEETQQLIDEYIHFYNYQRIQLKSKLTPYQVRCQSK